MSRTFPNYTGSKSTWGGGGGRHTDTFLGRLQDFWAPVMFKATFFLVGDFVGPLEAFSCPSWDAGTAFFFLVATPCPPTLSFISPLQTVSVILTTPSHGHFRALSLCSLCQMHRTCPSLALLPMWIEADLTSNCTCERNSSHSPWPVRYSGQRWYRALQRLHRWGG